MENFQKALQMAAAVFLFVIAATTSVFLYSTLITNTEKIIVISDNNRTSSEYAIPEDGDYSRKITRDEIIMTILDFENNTSYYNKIIVKDNNKDYTFTNNDPSDLLSVSSNNKYTCNYYDKTLTYTLSNID